MNVKHNLSKKLLTQSFAVEEMEELEKYRQLAQGYAAVEHCIAVLSDLKSDKSYVYHGALAAFFDFATEASTQEIDSIWEEDIFAHIHPDDLINKHLLELRLFTFVKKLDSTKRSQFYGSNLIRMKSRTGAYIAIKHRIFYVSCTISGSLRYALCLYNRAEQSVHKEANKHAVVDMLAGEVVPIVKDQLSSILSAREWEVLRLIRDGQISKEIASRLSISVNTVNRHRQNILEKLRVKNSSEACSVADRLHLF